MGNNTSPTPENLQEEVEKRKTWFLECQLRGLNMGCFRDVHPSAPGAMLDLISEPAAAEGTPIGTNGTRIQNPKRVYLDNGQAVWTGEEKWQRDSFVGASLGRIIDWLDHKAPEKLRKKIKQLKTLYENARFHSYTNSPPFLNLYPRSSAIHDEHLPHAISRAEIARKEPWLIGELYNFEAETVSTPEEWVRNIESFCLQYENELLLFSIDAHTIEPKIRSATFDETAYREGIANLVEQNLHRDISKQVQTTFVEELNGKYIWNLKVGIPGIPQKPIREYDATHKRISSWLKSYNLQNIYLNASDSDMGLCLIMRSLYLYGPLPDLAPLWRKRDYSVETLDSFFRHQWNVSLRNDPAVSARLEIAQTKLKILLDVNAAFPQSSALTYPLFLPEIIKQAITGYKFWLDEPFKFADNYGVKDTENNPQGINKARFHIKGDKDAYKEMEYWSENHYIMFASSEYLAGQLWPNARFQAAGNFLQPGDETGVLTGKERIERGRLRILKWLNNKLAYGWTEFNSTGYYREHLFALLNLVDFSLDEEVKCKATMVTDLLLFDIVRFQHKGSMGACGGRSQFTSKNNGWDNAPGDLVEILLGTRGIFKDKEGDLGTFISTSTYRVPDVLLEIGCNPPEFSYLDLCRVSVGFDEAPKYNIQISDKSEQKIALENAYRSKINKHFEHTRSLNRDISATHFDYGAMEDDTVFWWTMSGYYNKEVILNSATCVSKFKIGESEAFSKLDLLVAVGTLVRGIVPLGGFKILDSTLKGTFSEDAMDKLSAFVEGSTRTRANIMTYRNRDVMLSSIQNFRPGQLNFQSNVNQATLSTEISVFTTAAFAGLDLSNMPFAAGGAFFGGALGAMLGGPYAYLINSYLAGLGAYLGVRLNEKLLQGLQIGEQGDGPGWWTGYWALPMIIQEENVAIIAYQFHWSQKRLAETGSHAWLPRNAFDEFETRRTSAYDDENFPLFEITGKRGYWQFGKKIHRKDPFDPDNNEEAYIGIFSNRKPEWLNKDDDYYETQIKEKTENKLKDIKQNIAEKIGEILDEIEGSETKEKARIIIFDLIPFLIDTLKYREKTQWSNMIMDRLSTPNINRVKIRELVDLSIDQANYHRTWADPFPEDFFKDKDWYAPDKNIWIIQVGNKQGYGSFENFKDRLSSAPVKIDDVGNMECAYKIPRPDGSGQWLTLDYEDRKFTFNGNNLHTDWYPRFDNPFVRGNLVEWGQREYVIEYKGKNLLHRFPNFRNTERAENLMDTEEDLEVIKGLVIYIRTEDEDMDMGSIASATVKIGCDTMADEEVVAAGKVNENTWHDAEWIFFDRPARINPDMTVVIRHPPIPDGDDDPEWKMTFSLKALMGDFRLHDCRLSASFLHFEDGRRASEPVTFTINLNRWHTWKPVMETVTPSFWQITKQSASIAYYYNYLDVIALDSAKQVLHARLDSCNQPGASWHRIGEGANPFAFETPFSLVSYAPLPDHLYLLAINEGKFHYWWKLPGENPVSKQWTQSEPVTRPTLFFGIPDPYASPKPVPLTSKSQLRVQDSKDMGGLLEVFVSAGDSHFYANPSWHPGSSGPWRQISTGRILTPPEGAPFEISGDFMFILDGSRRLWAGEIDHSHNNIQPAWQLICPPTMYISNFVVAHKEQLFRIVVITTGGEIWSAQYLPSVNLTTLWERLGRSTDFKVVPETIPAWATPDSTRLEIFVTGPAGKIYTGTWLEDTGWKANGNLEILDDNGHHFENKMDKSVIAISRIPEQVEVYTWGDTGFLWKNWWT